MGVTLIVRKRNNGFAYEEFNTYCKVRSAFLPYDVPMDEFDCYNEVQRFVTKGNEDIRQANI